MKTISSLKKYKFGDHFVTAKAKKLLERAYAMKSLGLPCVVEFEQDSEEFDTLASIFRHVDDMGGYVLQKHVNGVHQLRNENECGEGAYLVYIP